MLRLRWTYLGRGYSLAMGLPDTPINRAAAEAKASKIQIDIALEQFDPTLQKYKIQTPERKVLTAELFMQFINWKLAHGLSQSSVLGRYRSLKNHLARFGVVGSLDDANELMTQVRKHRQAYSGNQALFGYREFSRWAMEKNYIEEDLFRQQKTWRVPPRNRDKRRPFNLDEIKAILETFASDKSLAYYHDFVLFMFALGVRPSEAIGLRWSAVDLDAGLVTISEAVIRLNSGGKPIRKGTKNGVVRTLKLTNRVAEMLRQRQDEQVGNDLVFPAPKGGYINNTAFLQRCWRKGCERAGVPYRPLYTTRHTLISYGIEIEGWSLPQAAQVAGDTVRTIAQYYAHAIESPKMPDF